MNLIGKVREISDPIVQSVDEKLSRINFALDRVNTLVTNAKNTVDSEVKRLSQERQQLDIARDRAEYKIEELENLKKDYCGASKKIASAYADFLFSYDQKVSEYFRTKGHPSLRASEAIAGYSKELRKLRRQNKEYEYLFAELWANEEDDTEVEDFEEVDEDDDPSYCFLSKEDYRSLPTVERNQLALDRYLSRKHSKSWIGRMYERQIGQYYEELGYKVYYRGIDLGIEDGGIDLECSKEGEVLLVQCKCWKQESIIYEKYICQLHGAKCFYDNINQQPSNDFSLFGPFNNCSKAVFATTTKLDEKALIVAKSLCIEVKYIELDKSYPMIKCNINDNQRIYHLPFDQQYDRVIINKTGEFYAHTVSEAESKGFRRAKRHIFTTE